MKRRGFLGVIATGFLGGCLSRVESPTETPTANETGPSETPITATTHTGARETPSSALGGTPTSSGRCTADYERVVAYTSYPTVTNRLNGFALTSNKTVVQPGDELTITLTNETDEVNETGNRSKYSIHRRVDGTWQSIFWKPSDELVYYHDDAIGHPPGEGFTWEFLITSEGLSHQIQNGRGHLNVCSSNLSPGSYRFVYHSVTSYDDEGLEAALGTQFTVSSD